MNPLDKEVAEWMEGLGFMWIEESRFFRNNSDPFNVMDMHENTATFFYEASQNPPDRQFNRFEIINHLSDGSGREVVVWKGEPFKVEENIQDDGRTLKMFLTDVSQLNNSNKEN